MRLRTTFARPPATVATRRPSSSTRQLRTFAEPPLAEADPPAFTRNRIRERDADIIRQQRMVMEGKKEELLAELQFDTRQGMGAMEEQRKRLMAGAEEQQAVAAALDMAHGRSVMPTRFLVKLNTSDC